MAGIPVSRRSPRVDMRCPAILVDSDGGEREAMILDVSSGGFRLEVAEGPRIAEFVTLVVERGARLPAQIRWIRGNEVGGVFLFPADLQL
jgi:hypothetical protein